MSRSDYIQLDSTNTKVDFVTDELLGIFNTINLAVLAAAVALFGVIANVFNIMIFVRQGLNDTVNIGLLALAISDFCSLVTLEWMCVLNNPLVIDNVPMILIEFQHLTAAWPHTCFARITSWLTVYITMERCLCVVIPLKVKRVITPKVTIRVITCIFGVMILTLVPDYATCYVDWRFVPEYNRSVLGLLFLAGREQMASLSFNLGVGTQMSSFGAVIFFTAMLVAKMKQKLKWRNSTSNFGRERSKETKTRDKKTVKMITLVAIIYCVCFLPMLAIYIAICIEPELIIFGVYNNSFFLCWSFVFFMESINSSVNIFVYYRMSTKYRTMFDSLILRVDEAKLNK